MRPPYVQYMTVSSDSSASRGLSLGRRGQGSRPATRLYYLDKPARSKDQAGKPEKDELGRVQAAVNSIASLARPENGLGYAGERLALASCTAARQRMSLRRAFIETVEESACEWKGAPAELAWALIGYWASRPELVRHQLGLTAAPAAARIAHALAQGLPPLAVDEALAEDLAAEVAAAVISRWPRGLPTDIHEWCALHLPCAAARPPHS